MSLSVQIPNMENLHGSRERNNICGSWLLKQKFGPHQTSLGSAQRDSFPFPGTTFPPFTHTLPGFRQNTVAKSSPLQEAEKCKFFSEPDLTPFTDNKGRSDGADEPEECGDDDYLFEFDIGSPDSSDDYDGAESVKIVAEVKTMTEEESAKALEMMGRRFSNSSQSSICSNSSFARRKNVDMSSNGFQTIFGSTSSGLGSDRRSSEETEDEAEQEDMANCFEGLSIPPEDWKECPYVLTSSADKSSQSSEGTATPILAASPAVDSPVLSPDSLLDSYHIQQDQELLYDEEQLRVIQSLITSEDGATVKQTTEVILSSVELTPTDEQLPVVSDGDCCGAKPGHVEETTNDDGCEQEAKDSSEVCDAPDSHSDDRVKVEPEQENSEEAKTTEEVVILEGGVQQHLIATSKLTALLSQLEQDRDYPKIPKEEGREPSPDEDGARRKDYLDPQDDNTPKLRKCSSLRSGRTPPGTPHVRKIVRFADIFGLDLTEVKTFADEIPHIPKSAFSDLQVDMSDFEVGSPRPPTPLSFMGGVAPPPPKPTTALVPMFNQPGGSSSFFEVLRSRKVCLENAFMVDGDSISGMARVQNLDFHKAVTVRWTTNNWLTQKDLTAQYVQGSSDGFSDKFSFRLSPGKLEVGSKVQFCLQYTCAGNQFWDSNGGGNYVFQVFVSNPPIGPTSRPAGIAIAGPRGGGGGPRAGGGAQFQSSISHSPSQHGDDPWLRFM